MYDCVTPSVWKCTSVCVLQNQSCTHVNGIFALQFFKVHIFNSLNLRWLWKSVCVGGGANGKVPKSNYISIKYLKIICILDFQKKNSVFVDLLYFGESKSIGLSICILHPTLRLHYRLIFFYWLIFGFFQLFSSIAW